jgi:GT2 family glycosyltransferase
MKIAVLLTTFNRSQKTVACLNSLKSQKFCEDLSIDIFLTDDNSSDDTVDAVKLVYPQSNVYHGTGSLFWAGGMRNSWSKALPGNYDYYLLINDDTVLLETAVKTLLNSSADLLKKTGASAVCVGSTQDVFTGEISYGGKKLKSKYYLKSRVAYHHHKYLDCDLGNANIMLVANSVVNSIGILSEEFTHGIADYDYTLRAKKAGFKVIVAPGVLGFCTDDHGKNWKTQKTKLADRIAYLKSPKGLAYKEYLFFVKSHFPLYYPFAFTKLWMKTLVPFVWQVLKK